MLLLLSACTSAGTASNPPLLTQANVASTPTYALATPYATQPAAGICATFDSNTVTITINVDVPDPRCAKVRSDQSLTIVNATLSTIQVSIGSFSSSILPGADYSIKVPFGEYLAPGVHVISVTPYFGAELWLEGN